VARRPEVSQTPLTPPPHTPTGGGGQPRADATAAPPRACVCGHVAAHHDKRKSIPQGLMADYKVIWGCGWTGCGCPRYVKQGADRV
jgi:hypothetical protein